MAASCIMSPQSRLGNRIALIRLKANRIFHGSKTPSYNASNFSSDMPFPPEKQAFLCQPRHSRPSVFHDRTTTGDMSVETDLSAN
jgi:hypothetical protein